MVNNKHLKPFIDLGFPLDKVSVFPLSTGGVQFEGECKNRYLEIEVEPEKKLNRRDE